MTDSDTSGTSSSRGGDRRGNDRRRTDRRFPVPPWRRPAAFVAYGLVAALLIVLLFRGGDEPEVAVTEPTAAARGVELEPLDIIPAGVNGRRALTIADFERLMAEGDRAVGQLVEAELYCGSIMPIALRGQNPDPRLSALADTEGRVAGAECHWSREARSADFLLVVPPQLAVEFAQAPEVELNFYRRRRVPANLIWLGRSDALALRIAGILGEIRGAGS